MCLPGGSGSRPTLHRATSPWQLPRLPSCSHVVTCAKGWRDAPGQAEPWPRAWRLRTCSCSTGARRGARNSSSGADTGKTEGGVSSRAQVSGPARKDGARWATREAAGTPCRLVGDQATWASYKLHQVPRLLPIDGPVSFRKRSPTELVAVASPLL